MTRLLMLALAGTTLGLAAPATAQSFSNNWDSNSFGSGPGFTFVQNYEGWFYDGGQGSGIEIQYNGVAGTPFSGPNFVEIDANGNISMSHAIAQAGSYVFTFLYSDRPNVPATSNGLSVLLNGTNLLTVPGGDGAGNTVWTPYTTVRFEASANSTLTISALGLSDGLGGYIDDVALVAVPEPATWGMMIAGIGAIGGTLRRRKAVAALA